MTTMAWSEDLPTEAGWYWHMQRGAAGAYKVPMVVRINYLGISHGEHLLMHESGDVRTEVSGMPGLWAGPIPRPKNSSPPRLDKDESHPWTEAGKIEPLTPSPLALASAAAWKSFHENARHLTETEREAFVKSASMWELQSAMVCFSAE